MTEFENSRMLKWTSRRGGLNNGQERPTACRVAFSSGYVPVVVVAGNKAQSKVGTMVSLEERELLVAVACNREEEVGVLLDRGVDVDAKDDRGETSLFKASCKGNEPIVLMLLTQGADVDLTTVSGRTPLMIASHCGHAKIVRLLLNAGADTDLEDSCGDTAINDADSIGRHDIVKMLKEAREQRRVAPLFYEDINKIAELLEESSDDDEVIAIVPLLRKACEDMSDFLQLKYFFTAVNSQYRLRTIDSKDRESLIRDSLQKSCGWCTSAGHVAVYVVALQYALSQGIIVFTDYTFLETKARENSIAETDYIQAMHAMIQQNTMRIDRVEHHLVSFQKAVENLEQNVKNIHSDVCRMSAAIEIVDANTQTVAGALTDLIAGIRFNNRVKAGFSIVSAALNAVSWGVAGSALQGILDLTVANIADFSDLQHLLKVGKMLPNNTLETVGSVSVEDMLETGIQLAEDRLANYNLDEALLEGNSIVMIAASAKMFSNALKLSGLGAPETSVAQLPTLPAETIEQPTGSPRFAIERPRHSDEGIPPENTDGALEMKLAKLENELKRCIENAQMFRKNDFDIDNIKEEIQQIDGELEELYELSERKMCLDKKLKRRSKAAELAHELGYPVAPILNEIEQVKGKIAELDKEIGSI